MISPNRSRAMAQGDAAEALKQAGLSGVQGGPSAAWAPCPACGLGLHLALQSTSWVLGCVDPGCALGAAKRPKLADVARVEVARRTVGKLTAEASARLAAEAKAAREIAQQRARFAAARAAAVRTPAPPTTRSIAFGIGRPIRR